MFDTQDFFLYNPKQNSMDATKPKRKTHGRWIRPRLLDKKLYKAKNGGQHIGVGPGKRTELQRAEDLIIVDEKRREGGTAREIMQFINGLRGGEYTLSVGTICNDIHEVEEAWLSEGKASRNHWVNRMVTRLEYQNKKLQDQIAVAEAEFEKSKQDAVTQRVKGAPVAGQASGVTPTEVIKVVRHQCGNPAYLAEIRQCRAEIRANLQEIARLKGLYPALRLDMEGGEGNKRHVVITFGGTLQPPIAPWREQGKVIDVAATTQATSEQKQLEATPSAVATPLTGAAAVAAVFQKELAG